jgi:hypothetical protein
MHLESLNNQATRRAQLTRVFEVLPRDVPFLLLGDFNFSSLVRHTAYIINLVPPPLRPSGCRSSNLVSTELMSCSRLLVLLVCNDCLPCACVSHLSVLFLPCRVTRFVPIQAPENDLFAPEWDVWAHLGAPSIGRRGRLIDRVLCGVLRAADPTAPAASSPAEAEAETDPSGAAAVAIAIAAVGNELIAATVGVSSVQVRARIRVQATAGVLIGTEASVPLGPDESDVADARYPSDHDGLAVDFFVSVGNQE